MRSQINIALCSILLALASGALAQSSPLAPWAVRSQIVVEQRQIIVRNAKARLAGTLFLPAGSRPRAVVIALHGAQVPLRTDPLYRHLTQIMPQLGIGVFLYDRRGSGLAFCAIFATLVLQCTTLGLVIRRLGLEQEDATLPEPDTAQARAELAAASLDAVQEHLDNNDSVHSNAAAELVEEHKVRAERASIEGSGCRIQNQRAHRAAAVEARCYGSGAREAAGAY